MARSKSTPGGKTKRTSTSKEQPGAGDTTSPLEGKTVAEAAPTASAEGRVAAEAGAVAEAKTTSEAKVAPHKVAPDARKFEIMKTEPRKNVVPINLEDEIRRRAYELYQQRGSGSGSEAEDWLNAEREVRQRYRQQSA